MREIQLTQGKDVVTATSKVALIDDEDYVPVCIYNWFAIYEQNAQSWYAVANERQLDGTYKRIRMHRLILSAEDYEQVDHRNHDGLDNRKENLRIVTNSQNGMNRRLTSANTSGYKGVCFDKNHRQYRAYIRKDGKRKYLGSFHSAVIAACAYDEAAKEMFGEYAYLNFPDESK